MYYTQGELYQGSTWSIIGYDGKGRPRYGHKPLDPALYRASMEFYHPKPKPPPQQYRAPEDANATAASQGKGIRRPAKTKSKRNIASLRKIRDRTQVNQTLSMGETGVGSGINPMGGSYA